MIAARFNGPPNSGNGGYSCGALAAFIDGPARVRLHVPPPLDKSLTVTESDDGIVQMHDGETLVGSGGSATLDLELPAPPSLAEAKEAMKGYPCYEDHAFPSCFVCGPGRSSHDGLEIYPGPVKGSSLLACSWLPAPDCLDADGNILAEMLWSALDCPGYYASMGDELLPAVLGELVGELFEAVAGNQELVVYAWPLGSEGRKFYGGTAIATKEGTVVAASHSTWIHLKG
jgi:hypothetical protein